MNGRPTRPACARVCSSTKIRASKFHFFFGLSACEFVPDFALIGPSHPVHLEISLLTNQPYCRLSATPAKVLCIDAAVRWHEKVDQMEYSGGLRFSWHGAAHISFHSVVPDVIWRTVRVHHREESGEEIGMEERTVTVICLDSCARFGTHVTLRWRPGL
jgi:hypothetical protein